MRGAALSHESAGNAAGLARDYYDSSDVDGFYATVWGGEDIHIGTYEHERETVADASRRTVEKAADKVADFLGPGSRVLDLGSGYGGAARYLAGCFGCRVVALNISESQNQRHRKTNVERGLADLIEVVTGSFEDVPYEDGYFDVVWSQEAFCHSDERAKVLSEAVRVLNPGGRLVFTDLMAADDAPPNALRPAVSRLGVEAMATPGFYRQHLAELGLSHVDFEDRSEHLLTHYLRILEETQRGGPELRAAVSPAYLDGLLENLPLWVDASRNGHLSSGIFHCHR
ncbi:methyltransferase domain-containing protein [Streptomyces triculaminicus]|uniref:Methyltransferase domain-containing protein n=1 Tax=Streptomyces triculaminicus TaxID=2816232 RepID=A0A939JRN6_9ACTN|nr:methyltransferase domain-containing protein [Streptomyces triculaminicus]